MHVSVYPGNMKVSGLDLQYYHNYVVLVKFGRIEFSRCKWIHVFFCLGISDGQRITQNSRNLENDACG